MCPWSSRGWVYMDGRQDQTWGDPAEYERDWHLSPMCPYTEPDPTLNLHPLLCREGFPGDSPGERSDLEDQGIR